MSAPRLQPVLLRFLQALLGLALLAAIPALAEPLQWDDPDPLFPHGFYFGGQAERFDYAEPSIDISLKGTLYGGRIGYLHRDADRLVLGVEADVVGGTTRYQGFLQDLSTGDTTAIANDSDDVLLNARVIIGWDYMPTPDWRLTPYFGVGFRHWWNHTEGNGSYRRRVKYAYSPLGLEAARRVAPGVALGGRGEFDIFWRGWVDSKLSDVDASLPDLGNDQSPGSGYGARAALFAHIALTDNVMLFVEPYFHYWSVEESEPVILVDPGSGTPVAGFVEPRNRTYSYGGSIGLMF